MPLHPELKADCKQPHQSCQYQGTDGSGWVLFVTAFVMDNTKGCAVCRRRMKKSSVPSLYFDFGVVAFALAVFVAHLM